MTSFGDKLRQAREKKGISLDDIAQITKIGTRQLAAIEAEDFDKLPGGIFNKGFVRSYARCVGLNEDETVAQYLEAIQESPAAFKADVGVTEFPPDREPVERANRSGIPFLPVLLGLGVLALLLAVVVWWRTSHSANEANPPPAPVPTSMVTPPASAPSVTTAAESSGAANPATSLAASPAINPGASSPGASSAQTSPQEPAKTGATQAAGGADGSAKSVGDAAVATAAKPLKTMSPPEAAVKADAKTEPKTEPATRDAIAVRVQARKRSWVKVQSDETQAREVTVLAGDAATFRAKSKLTLKLGNAGGVVVSFNGKAVELQAADGQVKTLNFDPSGLR